MPEVHGIRISYKKSKEKHIGKHLEASDFTRLFFEVSFLTSQEMMVVGDPRTCLCSCVLGDCWEGTRALLGASSVPCGAAAP